jgi:hypothetical protein
MKSMLTAVFMSILILFITGTAFCSDGTDRQSPPVVGKQIQRLEDLTRDLKAFGGREPIALQSATDLGGIAASRRQLLMALIEENPGEVLRHAISPEVRANLLSDVQPYIEECVEIEGELEVQVEDYHDRSRLLHFLVPSENGKERIDTRLSLHFAVELPTDLHTGTRVRLSGVRIGQAVALESGYTSVEALATALPNTFGEQKTAVILVNFTNDQSQPTTAARMKTVMAASDQFYREVSYQQTSLAADVFGWYTLPMTNAVCSTSNIKTYADQAAAAASVNLAPHARRVYMFPYTSASPWAGLSTLGGNPSSAWINGQADNSFVINHELGHGFGLYHSHGLRCQPGPVGTSCSVVEYGDFTDTMGNTYGHFNAFQKSRLGWLNYGASPPITTVQASGVYTIDAYEFPGAGSKALKIPRGTTGQSFYVELRRSVGFDVYLYRTGVFLHLTTDSDPNSSYELDMIPETPSFTEDAFLDVNKSFTDPVTGITISTLSVSSTNARIGVTMGGASCTRSNPSVAVSPTQSQPVQPGAPVTYTVSLTNQDSSGCSPSSFSLQAAIANGWTSVFGSEALSLNAGASGTTTLQVNSPASATAGTYTVGISAANTAFPTYAASASAKHVIGGGTNVFADKFDRADSTTLGNGWLEVKGDLLINATELKNGLIGDNAAIVSGVSGSAHTAAADFASTDNNGAPRFGIILRYQDPKNYYVLYRQTGGTSRLYISKVVNGVEKILKYIAIANPAKNGSFRLEGRESGTTLKLLFNGVEKLSVSDTTFTTGTVGILLGSKIPKSCRADNFNATAQ